MRCLGVVIALLALAAAAPEVDTDVSRLVDGFFSLFVWPCDKWVSLFAPNASFSHPKFPRGVRGATQLAAFCATAQSAARQQLFRADGLARITQTDTAVHVLVPYVWSAQLSGPDAPPFVNSGWEALMLAAAPQGLAIAAVTEFFNSNRTQL